MRGGGVPPPLAFDERISIPSYLYIDRRKDRPRKRGGNMTKAELVAAIAQKTGLKQAQAKGLAP